MDEVKTYERIFWWLADRPAVPTVLAGLACLTVGVWAFDAASCSPNNPC